MDGFTKQQKTELEGMFDKQKSELVDFFTQAIERNTKELIDEVLNPMAQMISDRFDALEKVSFYNLKDRVEKLEKRTTTPVPFQTG